MARKTVTIVVTAEVECFEDHVATYAEIAGSLVGSIALGPSSIFPGLNGEYDVVQWTPAALPEGTPPLRYVPTQARRLSLVGQEAQRFADLRGEA